MSILDLFKFNPGGQRWSPKAPIKPEAPKIEPKKNIPAKNASEKQGFFTKKPFLSRGELRWKLRQDSGKIPGGGGFFNRKQRENMEKEVFGQKYGSNIDEREYEHAMKKLREKEFFAKTAEEKTIIDRTKRFLKDRGNLNK